MLAGITCESSGQRQGCRSKAHASIPWPRWPPLCLKSVSLGATDAAMSSQPALQGASGEVLFSIPVLTMPNQEVE